MLRYLAVLILLIVLLGGCSGKVSNHPAGSEDGAAKSSPAALHNIEWRTIATDDVSFRVPSSFVDQKAVGHDTRFWKFVNTGIEIEIQYGLMASSEYLTRDSCPSWTEKSGRSSSFEVRNARCLITNSLNDETTILLAREFVSESKPEIPLLMVASLSDKDKETVVNEIFESVRFLEEVK